jgi:hypothetical protein
VAYGDVKTLLLLGVGGPSFSYVERVCRGGGGIGVLKSCFVPPGESGVGIDMVEGRGVVVLTFCESRVG